MFRSFSGSKARYQDLTLLVVSEFNEWKVLVYGPGVTIHGTRQFAEPKAREHAAQIAKTYYQEVLHTPPPGNGEPEWVPTEENDWLVWR